MDGYKCFNKNFKTNTGITLYLGKIYTTEQYPVAKQTGYHFCKNLEDTLRYFNGLEEEVIICKIKALGNISKYTDDWYEYEIYTTDKIFIEKELSREEIINYANKLTDYRLIRFIQGFKLTTEELEYFKEKYHDRTTILNYLKYYQEKDLKAFERNYKTKVIKLKT